MYRHISIWDTHGFYSFAPQLQPYPPKLNFFFLFFFPLSNYIEYIGKTYVSLSARLTRA